MKNFRLFSALWALVLTGCVAPKYQAPVPVTPDFAHLLIDGGWGDDFDIWVYSDDSYVVSEVAAASHRVRETRRGSKKGFFKSIVRFINRKNAWAMTGESLRQDAQKTAERRKQELPDVTDMDQIDLEIRDGGKILKADYYAAGFTLGRVPGIKSLDTFMEIVGQIRKGTETK